MVTTAPLSPSSSTCTYYTADQRCAKHSYIRLLLGESGAVVNPQTGNGVYPRTPATGGEGSIYPHTVKVILYAKGDRYRPAVKNMYSAK